MSFNAKGHGSETLAIPKARNTVYFGELCNALCRGFGLVTGDVTLALPPGLVPQMGNLQEIRI